jgi:hypothetical protein
VNVLFGAIDAVLYLAIAVILIRKYRRTRDHGLLWLGLPLVLFPFAALSLVSWMQMTADRLALGQQVGFFPYSLVEDGHLSLGSLLTALNLVEHTAWGLSALAAVLILSRRRPSAERFRDPA